MEQQKYYKGFGLTENGNSVLESHIGYFFSKEKLRELLEDVYVTGFDDAPKDWKRDEYINSLLDDKTLNNG